jgi:hypothetical protein
MKKITSRLIFMMSIFMLLSLNAWAEQSDAKNDTIATTNKVMVLDFQLHDLTDLAYPKEELARIKFFNTSFKKKLADNGVQIVPVNDEILKIQALQSPTYLFDHTDVAADLAKSSGADYMIVGVAMKPTYLFVYPRLLLVDVKTKRKAFTAYVQLEGSWLEERTTENSAQRLAEKVNNELKRISTLIN